MLRKSQVRVGTEPSAQSPQKNRYLTLAVKSYPKSDIKIKISDISLLQFRLMFLLFRIYLQKIVGVSVI